MNNSDKRFYQRCLDDAVRRLALHKNRRVKDQWPEEIEFYGKQVKHFTKLLSN